MINRAKSTSVQSDTATPKLLATFISVQNRLIAEMELASTLGTGTPKGDATERKWKNLLREYLPNRYGVEKGRVVDSRGGQSDQIDIIIFDPQYTPTLQNQENDKYIPSEAVYAVFEVKQNISKKYIDEAQAHAQSVRRLHRTSVNIAHAGGTYAPKTPFPILAGILAWRSTWAPSLGKAFESSLSGYADLKLDCGCVLDAGCFDDYDGKLSVVTDTGALMYFLFRLLSKLQSLGTVPAIDWNAYSRIIR